MSRDARSAEDLVRQLKPRLTVYRLRHDPESRSWKAGVTGPFFGAYCVAEQRDEAIENLAVSLAYARLPGMLSAAGWTHVARLVDEVEVVRAVDTQGATWAIAIGEPDDRRKADFAHVTAGTDRSIVVPPDATRSAAALVQALAATPPQP